MIIQTREIIQGSFGNPDEVQEFPNGKFEVVKLGERTVGRITLQPGWRWSKDLKGMTGTESCENTHTQFVISGRLKVEMRDGGAFEFGPAT